MIILDTPSGPRAISDNKNRLLVYDVNRGSLEHRVFENRWVVRVIGRAGELIVAELYGHEPFRELSLELVVIDRVTPSQPVARLAVSDSDVRWSGDDVVWTQLPRLHTRQVDGPPPREFLIYLGQGPGQAEILEVPEISALMDGEYPLLIADRSDGKTAVLGRYSMGSALVAYDLGERRARRTISLPGTLSTYQLRFRPGTWELWAACNGHLVRVDVERGAVLATLDVGTSREDDLADFGFAPGYEFCVVALYRSGVVLAVEVESFTVAHRAETAESLAEVALLSDGRFVAKAWNSEQFIVGPLLQ
jgi:hypothetical protein